MNPQPPPTNDQTPWSWIGEDALQAGVYAMQGPLITYNDNDVPVYWFQKKTTAHRHLNVRMVKDLQKIGLAYVVIYLNDGTPSRVVDMRSPNRSRAITRKELHDLLRLQGQLKP